MTPRPEPPGHQTTGHQAKADTPDREAPKSASEALQRAQTHARRAIGEAFAALQALVDAASLGMSGRPSEASATLKGISELLDEQSRRFRDGEVGVPMPVMTSILDALDQEIGRWEKRASRDPDARAVLRTFLGVREILWEFGFRRDAPQTGPEAPRAEAARKRSTTPKAGGQTPKRRSRVQRVDVQG